MSYHMAYSCQASFAHFSHCSDGQFLWNRLVAYCVSAVKHGFRSMTWSPSKRRKAGMCLEKTVAQGDTWTPLFTAALFTTAKTRKQPVSMDRWKDEELRAHTASQGHTGKGMRPPQKQGRTERRPRWVTPVRQGNAMHVASHVWNLKEPIQMNVSTRHKQTQR